MNKTNEIIKNGFYLVTANFDMAEYGHLEVETFLNPENAIKFAESMKQEFIDEIPWNGALDEEETVYESYESDDLFYFYGVSENGENFVTIRVKAKKFADLNEVKGGKKS